VYTVDAMVALPNQFVHGYHRALYLGAALLFVGATVSLLTVRKPSHREPQLRAESAVA
jgi:hypothetical protein